MTEIDFNEEAIQKFVELLGLGFYRVTQKGEFVECDSTARKIFNIPREAKGISKYSIAELYVIPEERKRRIDRLMKDKGKPLCSTLHLRIDNENKTLLDICLYDKSYRDQGYFIGFISDKIEREDEIKETAKRLENTETDMQKFIHTLLHPVVRLTGKSKLLHQVTNILHQTIPPVTAPISDSKKLGKELMTELIEIQESLYQNNDIDPMVENAMKEKLATIINVFDHSLKTERNKVLLDSKIRDTALWVVEELNGANYFQEKKERSLIEKKFIELLQGILLNYLKQNAEILMGEIEMMNRRVEGLRKYIGLEKQRKYVFSKHDIEKILEENLEIFKPILSEKDIDIRLKPRGNLIAEISRYDIDRVISNLFQNVINYSYKGKGRFVKVTAREMQPQNEVELSIESFGIPIRKEEIESGDIFKFGHRGVFSYKGDRDGIGIGLADTKDVVEAHGGEISITSVPAKDDGDPPQYKVPYRTKVTIRIPRIQKGKE